MLEGQRVGGSLLAFYSRFLTVSLSLGQEGEEEATRQGKAGSCAFRLGKARLSYSLQKKSLAINNQSNRRPRPRIAFDLLFCLYW